MTRIIIKGATTTARRVTLLEDEPAAIQQHAIAKAAQKQMPGTVFQNGGLVRLGDVRAKVVAKHDTELEKAERALRRAAAAVRKQKEIEWALHPATKPFQDVLYMDKMTAQKFETKRRETCSYTSCKEKVEIQRHMGGHHLERNDRKKCEKLSA